MHFSIPDSLKNDNLIFVKWCLQASLLALGRLDVSQNNCVWTFIKSTFVGCQITRIIVTVFRAFLRDLNWSVNTCGKKKIEAWVDEIYYNCLQLTIKPSLQHLQRVALTCRHLMRQIVPTSMSLLSSKLMRFLSSSLHEAMRQSSANLSISPQFSFDRIDPMKSSREAGLFMKSSFVAGEN